MKRNTKEKKDMERIAILELAYKGHNYRQISSITGANLRRISEVLHDISVEAKDQITSKWFTEFVPLTTKLRLMQLDECRKICWDIIHRSKDDRVVLQAVAQLNTLDTKFNDIVLSTEVIDRAIGAQRNQMIQQEIHQLTKQHQDQDLMVSEKTDNTKSEDTSDNGGTA